MAKRTPTRIERSYSDEEKADALLALEIAGGLGHIKATAEAIGVPVRTLNDWYHGRYGITPAVAKIRHHKKTKLADGLYDSVDELLAQIRKRVPETTDLRSLATALGIITDKAMALTGDGPATDRTVAVQINNHVPPPIP